MTNGRSLSLTLRINNLINEHKHDKETCHILLDELLVEELESLGYNLEAYKRVSKWYA